MAAQTLAQSSPTPKLSTATIITELFALATTRDVEQVLDQALGLAMQALGAEAGSILFQTHATTRRVRVGTFQPGVSTRVEHWEEVIGKRLSETTWTISAESELPISVSKADKGVELVNIPLLREVAVVGSLSLVLPAGQTITAEERQVLGQIARGAGQITSLILDLESALHRLNQMSVFYQVGQALVTTFDINRLLSDTMQLAANVIDAGASSIMLIDEEKKELVFEITHGSRSQMLRQQRIPLDEGIAGWVARHGHPVIANNARTDPRFSHRVDVRTGFLTQSIAAVPLKIKGRMIGVLEVLNKYSGDGFDQEDIQLMSSIAAQAAIAIENARLYQQVRQERDQIIKAQEEVRWEIARNLHDGPVQLLSAISMNLDHLERLNQVNPEAVAAEIGALRELVKKATREARTVLFELRPVILETQGLVAALERYIEHLKNTERFTIHFNKGQIVNFERRVAGTIFLIIQEAVNNIKRHAVARNVWLSLGVKHGRFIATVRDDGLGFDVQGTTEAYDELGSLGLLNMRERAKLIEAELRLESHTEPPNRGTIVQLILSLPSQVEPESDTTKSA
jgi:signal transduction histidine kinase